LATRGEARVRALARSPEAEARLRALGGRDVVGGDLAEPASLTPFMAGGDRLLLISPYGLDQVALERAAIDAAVAAGVRHVVKLSVTPVAGTDVGLFRRHAEIEATLAAAPLTATILQPEHFMDNLLAQAGGIAAGTVVQAAPRDAELVHVDARDVAAVAVHALTAPTPPVETLRLTGPEGLTADGLAAALGAGLGRPVAALTPTPEEFAAGAAASGVPAWMVEEALGSWDLVVTVPRVVGDGVRRMLGREPTPVATWAREVLAPAVATTAAG
jgi:uncharacterized protein YbjT (DUF2867 family)